MRHNPDVTAERYLDKVKKEVKRSGDQDLSYFSVFAQEVESYLVEKPQAGEKELEKYFGTPGHIADMYLETLPDEAIRKKIIIRKRLFAFARAAILFLVIVMIVLYACHVYDVYKYTHGYSIRSVYEGTPPPLPNNVLVD